MSEQTDRSDRLDVSRRTFVKAAGAAAGAGLFGAAADPAAAATEEELAPFLDWRVREARKVWARGYRGRLDRPVGLTDSGVDARHPDVGPWNGVRIELDGADGRLVENPYEPLDETVQFAGTVGPGTDGTGQAGDDVSATAARSAHPFTAPERADRIEAGLAWEPATLGGQDLALILEARTDDGWAEIDRHDGILTNPQALGHGIEGGARYRLVVQTEASARQDYEIDAVFYTVTGDPAGDDVIGRPIRGSVWEHTDPADKVVGWYDAGPRYGEPVRPRNAEAGGHGTHVSSIMSGTGRASTIDADRARVERPSAVLVAGDTLEYEIEAEAGTGVFASVYGREVDVLVEGPDGRTLATSRLFGVDASLLDNNVVQAPTVHDGGRATYTVIVRPPEGEVASAAQVAQVAVGPLRDPDGTDGDRTGEGDPTLLAGLAPDAGIVGLQGLSEPTTDLGAAADFFASEFNLRMVNMSWGYLGGLPLGAAGGTLDGIPGVVSDMAESGILTVAAAGNSFTPANGNGAPAVADEAISVVATGPLDGVVGYSSGGVGGADEDDDGTYLKPDVTAPGGRAPAYPASIATGGPYDLILAAESGEPDRLEREQTIRGYVGAAGTSMASPYVTGATNLVAQAMETDAPEAISLASPAGSDIEDVLRLKQAVLATASETVFTAAPYHEAKTIPHQPTYDHGGRDPYEGYGRVNPEAAVDAVTRDLLPADAYAGDGDAPHPRAADPGATYEATSAESVGLDVPADARAVAGYVQVRGGTLDVSVEFSHYSGGNKGMTKGDPHVDLFVYDAEDPAAHGEPNVVASAMGPRGSASVSVDVDRRATRDEPFNRRTFYVVAKLVNVPGAVNGYDVQAHLDLDLSFAAAPRAPLPSFSASGSRADDGSVFTEGQTDKVDVTIAELSVPDAVTVPPETTVRVLDRCPWEAHEDAGDLRGRDGDVVDLGTTTLGAIRDGGVTRTYFAEAPGSTGQYTFGPARVELVDDVAGLANDAADFGGTDTNTVVGASTNTDEAGDSVAGDAGSTVDDATGGTTDDATDAVDDAIEDST